MKKTILWVAVSYILVGVISMCAAVTTETKVDGLFAGLAGAGIVPGVGMLYQYF